jgi:hypothetical protein
MTCIVNYSRKGQFKIQQMAFVLVALMIFFAMVALFYFSIRISGLRADVESLEEKEAKEIVKKLATTSEFIFSAGDCENCIDLDKVWILKDRESYDDFWGLDFLQIRRVHPEFEDEECTNANYPECNIITLIDGENFGAPSDAFVSLCRWESENGGYSKCELGRIFASGVK